LPGDFCCSSQQNLHPLSFLHRRSYVTPVRKLDVPVRMNGRAGEWSIQMRGGPSGAAFDASCGSSLDFRGWQCKNRGSGDA
jgi:hypothetical protein